MNRLKAYCRRTVLESARNSYSQTGRRTKQGTCLAFADAMRGTDSGWWGDLIYTSPMLDMAHHYRRDISNAIREFLSETGARLGDVCESGGALTWADLLDATARRVTHDQLHQSRNVTAHEAYLDYGFDPETVGDAKLFGLRFAVGYLTGDLAREYCPEL